ncbi:FG-GAP repeat domain-containing protein [Streptomyces buecherae]|uniref:VCBS repeat-containing protein n=1 Tax=Streptomyces buecherae TaxID=2763006 RepID=A0A7H8NF28_9ACTN|nr:VCBS repeat-containing protein [Streptomyces buecherae]QKW53052.1 VCBS repeat-containing protein [Streptomyces buecherae]
MSPSVHHRRSLALTLAGVLALGVTVLEGTASASPTPAAATASADGVQDKGSHGQGAPSIQEQQRSVRLAAERVTRSEALTRASSWVGLGLTYNQNGTYQGYRRDCSGFVSMAWKLGKPGLATPNFVPSGAARSISKAELRPGDALNNDRAGNDGHIVLFEGWADAGKNSYWGYEFSSSGVHHRKIPYPYFSGSGTSNFKPIRNVNIVDDDTPPPGDAGMTDFVGGDFTGDGRSDVVARAKVNGTLFVYPGNGAGALEARRSMGTGWDSLDELTGGDFNGDGNTDIAARAKSDGTLFIYPGNGAGSFNSPIMAGTGWNHVEELTGGDFNSDGKADIAARTKADGTLFIYPGNGAGTFDTPIMAGTGWNHLEELTGGDFNSDGKSDIAARAKADGTLFIYPGNGASTFNSPVSAGSGWNIMRDIFSADLNGDGNTDITGVQAPQGTSGNMYLYPGTGQNTFATRYTLGTGW